MPGGRSKLLRGVDYERVLRAVGAFHSGGAGAMSVWTAGPVMPFAERIMGALATIVDGASYSSVSTLPDPASREYRVLASARICSEALPAMVGLNKVLAEKIRDHAGYRGLQDAFVAGRVAADTEFMTRREIESSAAWNDIYVPRQTGFCAGFALEGRTDPYYAAVFRLDVPITARELAMMSVLREQVLRCPPGMRQVEVDIALAGAPAGKGGRFGLTTAEAEVLQWICEGKRDGEIAVILGKSVRTINAQVRGVLAKLGVETRTGAVQRVMGM